MPFHPTYLPMLVPGGGSSGTVSALEGVCDISVQVGQFVYVAGNTVAGKRIFGTSSALVKETLPTVGIVVQKPSATTCKVASMGAVTLPAAYPSLLLGQIAFLGTDGFPSSILLTTNPNNVYAQRVGTVSKPNELILNIGEEVRLV